MAGSPTRPTAESPARLAVAVSGGRDSIALLHCTARLARPLDIEVHALHVHHGLMAQADAWQAQLRRQCQGWARRGLPVRFHATRLQTTPPAGASVEAWARAERYRALATMARAADCTTVLLAHHQRDQAETFLLQALRGGAPRGLAAMPVQAERHQLQWVRPWLRQPRAAIDAYLAAHRLGWVDDDSNADSRFDRSRLRAQVWPALELAFPDAAAALAAAGARAFEAAECLRELAAIDAGDATPNALEIARLRPLSPARRANALRHALAAMLGASAPQSLVQRLLLEMPAKTTGRWPAPGGELRLHGGRLSFALAAPGPDSALPAAKALDLRRPGRHALPAGLGTIIVERTRTGGVDRARLRAVEARARVGEERFAFESASLPRSLKKQFQAQRVPEWERDGPLLFSQGKLLFVPGLGIDGRVRAEAGAPQLSLRWERKAADSSRR